MGAVQPPLSGSAGAAANTIDVTRAPYNAVPDAQVNRQASMASGSTTLTTTAGMHPARSGDVIVIEGAGNSAGTAPLITTVVTASGGTTCTVLDPCLATAGVAGVAAIWGTDSTAAFQAALDALPGDNTGVGAFTASGGTIDVPAGTSGQTGAYLIKPVGVSTQKAGVIVRGLGAASMSAAVKPGSNPTMGGPTLLYIGSGNALTIGPAAGSAITQTNFASPVVTNLGAWNPGRFFTGIGVAFRGVTHWACEHCAVFGFAVGVSIDGSNNAGDSSWGSLKGSKLRNNAVNVQSLDVSTEISGGDVNVNYGQAGYRHTGGSYLKMHDTKMDMSGILAWQPNHAYHSGDIVKPTVDNGHWYTLSTTATSGTTEPTWPTTGLGTTVQDGLTYKEQGVLAANTGPVSVIFDTGISTGGLCDLSGTTLEHHTDTMSDNTAIGVDVRCAVSGLTILAPQYGGGGGFNRGTAIRLNGTGSGSGLLSGAEVVAGTLQNWDVGIEVGQFTTATSIRGTRIPNPGTTCVKVNSGALGTVIDDIYCGALPVASAIQDSGTGTVIGRIQQDTAGVVSTTSDVFRLVGDGVPLGFTGTDYTAGFQKFIASGKRTLLVNVIGTVLVDQSAGLQFSQHQRIYGLGPGITRIAPKYLWKDGALFTWTGDQGQIDLCSVGPSGTSGSTTTAGLTLTEAGLSSSTISLSSVANFPVPGAASPDGGTYPATLWAGFIGSGSASGFPGFMFSYTGVSGNTLTGCVIHAATKAELDRMLRWDPALETLTASYTFTIPSGSQVKLMAQPIVANALLRYGTTPGVDDVQHCKIGDSVEIDNWVIGVGDVGSSQCKLGDTTISGCGYASYYRADNAAHPDLGTIQWGRFDMDSSMALYGIYHGNAGGINTDQGKINKHAIAYRNACNVGSFGDSNNTTNQHMTGVGMENFFLVGLWGGGGTQQFGNTMVTGCKWLCSARAYAAVILEVNYDDVQFGQCAMQGGSGAATIGIDIRGGDGRRIGVANKIANFKGTAIRRGVTATRVYVSKQLRFPGCTGPIHAYGNGSVSAPFPPGSPTMVGNFPDTTLRVATQNTTPATKFTVTLYDLSILRVRLLADGQAGSGAVDVVWSGVLTCSGSHVTAAVADAGYPINTTVSGTVPAVTFDVSVANKVAVKWAAGAGSWNGRTVLEIVQGVPAMIETDGSSQT